MAGSGFNTQQLLLLLAVVAIIVGCIFHVIYLVKDRTVETAQDTYNSANANRFYLLAIALAVIATLWGKQPRMHASVTI